jgi:disulfide bond formation protein DsbB
MRLFILPLIFIAATGVQAQQIVQDLLQITSAEQKRHEQRFDFDRLAAATSASVNFDVRYYRAEWEVNPALKYIKGKVTTHFTMTEAGNSIALDLSGSLVVAKVEQAGSPLSFAHANHTLQINFPSSIPAGSVDSVSIFYEGAPVTTALEVSAHGDVLPLSPVMWTLSEPYGSKDWWPCKNGLDDKADSIDIYINTLSVYKAASNGILQSETPVPGGRTVTHWKHRYPIASYLVSFAVTNYVVFNDNVTIGNVNMPMQTYCYPESAPAFQAGSQTAIGAMQLFSTLFGDYPFAKEKYGHVQFGWGGGMEHQTCSFMYNMGETLITHELAHQWFGDKVTCATWQDIWLNEGFATYLSSLYADSKYPQMILTNRTAAVNVVTSAPGGSVWVDNINDVNRIFDHRLSYVKGSCLLNMLRWILGDAAFFSALKNYLDDASLSYGFATTNDLKNHLETASGKNLTYFFDQWFTGQGYPSYQLEWYQEGNAVEFKLNQTSSHPSVGFFKLPVPVLFRNNQTGQEKLVVADHVSTGQIFTENIGFAADTVIIDPEKWLISKNNSASKSQISLPVKFISFKLGCEGIFTKLSWETSEEVNASHFEIQKSEDMIDWKILGSVGAAGESTSIKAYGYTDMSYETGSYFRIMEVDRDGKRQYSKIGRKVCDALAEHRIVISPNPVGEHLTFEISDPLSKKGEIFLYNIKGTLSQVQTVNFRNDKRRYELDVSLLQPGLYVLMLKNEEGRLSKPARFMKE